MHMPQKQSTWCELLLLLLLLACYAYWLRRKNTVSFAVF